MLWLTMRRGLCLARPALKTGSFAYFPQTFFTKSKSTSVTKRHGSGTFCR
ncbi:hypothetical protein RMSM_07649 [Rhodopirellula maiorica SM1]|uniref:Uncharacterized protein n=1 Tax=Rhodopirellula maiorica SM1 TaxID=1265738 RepID=M5RN80_9BACT|nr:hypothetical protein RMSM_07649 [Rhodopirellula maiorica SM1]